MNTMELTVKVGDMVRYKSGGPTLGRYIKNTAVIIEIDDSHRQKVCTLLMDTGRIVQHVWDRSLEVINEDR